MSPLRPRRPYIVAEAGSCHAGSLKYAIELIDIAKDTDCDAIKFQYWSSQYWSSPGRMRERRHFNGSEAYEEGSVRARWLPALDEYSHACGLDFLCSVYLPEDVATLAPLVTGLKIASFESRNTELLQACLRYNLPLFISTGMQTGAEVARLLRSIVVGASAELRVLLPCVSAYPCPPEEANLSVLGQWLGIYGFSDHTHNMSLVSAPFPEITAVAMPTPACALSAA